MAEITYIQNREWYKRFKRQEFLGTHNNSMFGDVPFIFVDDNFGSGRRIVRHEFPQRDIPYSEDLGRRIRTITIQGELLGDDYLTQRDNLLFVCEEGGAKELIHPYYGILTVECDKINITNVRTETRVCKFQAVFTEKGKLEFPTSVTDTTTTVLLQTQKIYETAGSDFISTYDKIVKLIGAIDGKIAMLNKSIDDIEKSRDRYVSMPDGFKKNVETYSDSVVGLVNNAEALFDSTLDLITYGIFDRLEDYASIFNGLVDILDFSPEVRVVSDDSDSIKDIVQYITLGTMAYLSSVIQYESTNEAESFKKILLDKIDELVLTDLSDQFNQDLRDLRKVVVEDIDSRSINLPTITSYVPLETVPALVISYILYGTVDDEQNIINRNNLYTFNFSGEPITENILGIQHPGFVPGGEELEVLLNV